MKLALILIVSLTTLSCIQGGYSSLPAGRDEAVSFCKLLTEQQTNLNNFNSSENLLREALRPWALKISSAGGMEPEKQEAIEFWKRADSISKGLKGTVLALKEADLKTVANQTTRASLVTTLQSRQEDMNNLTSYLKGCVDNLDKLTPVIPNAINRVKAKLNTMKTPDDVFGSVINELRSKYNITDSELKK